MKQCNKCNEIKPLLEFTFRKLAPKKDGTRGISHKSNCKDCASIVRVCAKYGISEANYRQMMEQQNNLCKICGQPETTIDSRYGKTRVLSVDHCHTTGKVRGILCEDCNRALGLFRDNTDTIQKALYYLRKGA